MLPTLLKYPVTPSTFTSGIPPALLDITGTRFTIASSAASPKLSASEGSKKRSEKQSILSISLLLPKNRTFSSIPNSLTKASAASRSGPSPTISSLEGISSCKR